MNKRNEKKRYFHRNFFTNNLTSNHYFFPLLIQFVWKPYLVRCLSFRMSFALRVVLITLKGAFSLFIESLSVLNDSTESLKIVPIVLYFFFYSVNYTAHLRISWPHSPVFHQYYLASLNNVIVSFLTYLRIKTCISSTDSATYLILLFRWLKWPPGAFLTTQSGNLSILCYGLLITLSLIFCAYLRVTTFVPSTGSTTCFIILFCTLKSPFCVFRKI